MHTSLTVLFRRVALLTAAAALMTPALAARQTAPAPPAPPSQNPNQNPSDAGNRPAQAADEGQREGGQFRRRGGGPGGFGLGGPGGGRGPGGGGGGMRDLREQLEPDFMRRDIPIFIRQLKLTDAQTPVLEELMKDYEEEYTKSAEEAQSEMQDMGQKVFSNIFTPEMRDRAQNQMRDIEQDLQKLAEEKGGELDEETRRAFFRDRMAKMQQEMANERKASGADAEMRKTLTDMFEKVNGWMTKKAAMRTHFVDGLKASLDDDQLVQWPAFDRFVRREKTLPRGRLAGENTNLIFVLDELKLPEDDFAKVEKSLDPYETKLDAALVERNNYLESSMPKLFRAMQEGDVKECNHIFDRQMQLRTRVRDANDEARQEMVVALGQTTESAKKFEKAALADGYERVYRPTTTERSFDKAMEFEGLDPAVKQGIEDLRTQYLNELGSRNHDLVQTVKKNEPAQQAEDAGRFVTFMAAVMTGDFSALGGAGFPFGGRGGGGPGNDRPDDPVRQAFDSRTKFNDEYLTRLKAMLTPEQVAELPQRQGRGGGGPGGGGLTRMLDALPADQKALIMKKVDKNGNGQIDDDERGELFQTMRDQGVQMFGQDGPGGGGGGNADGQGGGRRRGGAARE